MKVYARAWNHVIFEPKSSYLNSIYADYSLIQS